MLSGKDITAFVLAAAMMLAPLAAAAYGARNASPATVEKSGAMPPGDNSPPVQARPSDAANPLTSTPVPAPAPAVPTR